MACNKTVKWTTLYMSGLITCLPAVDHLAETRRSITDTLNWPSLRWIPCLIAIGRQQVTRNETRRDERTAAGRLLLEQNGRGFTWKAFVVFARTLATRRGDAIHLPAWLERDACSRLDCTGITATVRN